MRRRAATTVSFCLAGALFAGCAAPDEERAADLVAADVDGGRHALFDGAGERSILLLFAATECPISNYFAPEVRRIHTDYASRGVDFYLVYADEDESPESIREHLTDFEYPMTALLDFDRRLVDYTGATMTPEAALLSNEGELLYRGRIDDTYVDYGKQRVAPTRRDLRLALDAVLDGRAPDPDRTETIGCYIPDPVRSDA